MMMVTERAKAVDERPQGQRGSVDERLPKRVLRRGVIVDARRFDEGVGYSLTLDIEGERCMTVEIEFPRGADHANPREMLDQLLRAVGVDPNDVAWDCSVLCDCEVGVKLKSTDHPIWSHPEIVGFCDAPSAEAGRRGNRLGTADEPRRNTR